MITVFLRGGLGNQMFQYALGLNLAKKNDTALVLDTVFLRDRFPRRNFAYRTYDLDIFLLESRFTPLSRTANAVPLPGVWLGLDLVGIKARTMMGIQTMVREKSDDFEPSILDARGDLILFGRWQREQYFADITGDVRRSFRFRHPLEGEAKELGEKIAAQNSIALHVRRGDFAAFAKVTALMGETDISYYSRAVAYLAERLPHPHFFVFSDDINWCRKNIKLPFPVTYVGDAAAGPKAAFHLELMSRCKHNIIAPSTFSWWAAWLNANPEKIVIAPKRWYADAALGEQIVPASWIRI